MISVKFFGFWACCFFHLQHTDTCTDFVKSCQDGLFFVVGTLPAAIQLASYSRIPWSQTWGMMFTTSFAAIELVTLLAFSENEKIGASVPEILGFNEDDWYHAQNQQLRSRILLLDPKLIYFEVITFTLASVTHWGIGVWAVHTIWAPALSIVQESDLLHKLQWVIMSYDAIFGSLFCYRVEHVGFCTFFWDQSQRGHAVSQAPQ